MAGGTGFEEAQAAFTGFAETSYVGQVRRFGARGPAYEVVGMTAAGDVRITVLQSVEQLTYPIIDLLADPMAETVP